MEAFNKILEHVLTKICNVNQDAWDLRILVALWAYHTTCNKVTRKIAFRLVYGHGAIIPMEFIVSSLRIVALIELTNFGAIEKIILDLVELEEDYYIKGFYQHV